MAVIHLIQQGKGGVGKSMIASFLYQALLHLGKEVTAFDTDPVNATLAGFKEFSVRRKEIIKDGNIDSIRINDQWRVCFVWSDGHATQVAIVDYH